MRAKTLLALAILVLAGASSSALVAPSASAGTGTTPLCSETYHVVAANWDFCWQQDDLRVQGLEINDAKYQGMRVWWKAGVPFSITRYHLDAAGPYKDALGNAGAGGHPGYGLGSTLIPATSCPRFLGTGTLVNGGKTCIETSSGVDAKVAIWARYNVYNYKFIHAYVFHADGRVEPQLLFGGYLIDGCATGSSCVSHFHNAYWRFDFDILGDQNDTVQSFHRSEAGLGAAGTLNLAAGNLWTAIPEESVLVRDYGLFNKWRVIDDHAKNAHFNARSYEVLSGSQGPGDGVSTADGWVFAYKGDSREIGYEVPTNPMDDQAYMDRYVSGDAVAPGDVVLWTVDHVFHEPRDEETPTMIYHSGGPVLKPRNFLDANNVEFTGS